MIVASMAAPAQKAAPQTGTGAGELPASGGTPADDQRSFESVLAHEEHTPAPPTGAGSAASGIPRSPKVDEGKKPADGAASLVPAPVVAMPAPILAALLAAATPPAVAAPTKITDVATGSPEGMSAAVGVAMAGKTDPRPVDLAGSAAPALAAGALEALVPGQANRTDQSDQSGQRAGADQPVTGTTPHPVAAAASGSAVLSRVAAATQSQVGAVASADPTSRGKVQGSIPAMVGGTDTRGMGHRAASQGSETLLHAGTTAAPLIARDMETALPPLLAGGMAKTVGEARDSGGVTRPAGDPRTSAGIGTALMAPLAAPLDAGIQKPARDRPTSNQGPAQITDKPVTNLDPVNLARPALGGGFAATISTVGQGVGQWTSRTNGDDHVAPAPPLPLHNQADAVGPREVHPITLLPDPADAVAPQEVIGPTSGLSQSRSFHPAEAGGPSAHQTSPPEALHNQPGQGSETRVQTSAAVIQTPLSLSGSTQPRPQTASTHPGPIEPGRVAPNPAAGPDHRSAASAPSRGAEGSSVQSWANGAGALPVTQHAQLASDAARTAPASQAGAVHQPIAQEILVRQASLQTVGAATSFKVVLHPRSLGEVTVQVTRVQEGLQVTIAPQQLTTQTLLNKHLPDLLGTLRTGQDLPVQAQVVAPQAPAPLGTPDAAAAGQSSLNLAANGGGQPFPGGQGGGEQHAWAGTMNDLLREPARVNSAAGPVARRTAARMVGNPRIDVHA